MALGNWEQKESGVEYTATTDGIVMASVLEEAIYGYMEGSTPSGTIRVSKWCGLNSKESFTMPVKSGDTWKVNGMQNITVWWLPLS